ncbi:MAG: DUF4907 domain-containing protein [Chitinophagales bacterium]|nr:DUF4907 domain-containing protein [Chitinophagales bacterium]
MKLVFIGSILIMQLFASCNSSSSTETTQEENSKDSINISNEEKVVSAALASSNDSTSAVAANISVKTIETNAGFGYDIYTDGKLSIHQPNIPAVSGNSGFKNEADAKRTGDFIAYKISHGIMPPSVTPEELDSLGVIRH